MSERVQPSGQAIVGEICPGCGEPIVAASITYPDSDPVPFRWVVAWTCRVFHVLPFSGDWYSAPFDSVLDRLGQHCASILSRRAA